MSLPWSASGGLWLTSSETTPIVYPKPDGILSFDILTSVARTGTNHAEGQPSHLRLPQEAGAKARHTHTNVTEYAGLLGNACPAAVYEYQDAEGADADSDGKKFVINSQNCIHVSSGYSLKMEVMRRTMLTNYQCKTCSIKVPTQDITWTGESCLSRQMRKTQADNTVPEGGGGPKYSQYPFPHPSDWDMKLTSTGMT